MAALHFELVSPERLMFSGEVADVIVPGAEGEFQVFVDHAPVMAVLKPGIVDIGETGGTRNKVYVRGGFADVAPRGLTILAEAAIPFGELNGARINAEIEAAQEGLAREQGDTGRQIATERLDRLRELKDALKL
jgi:F-type H+-transporting ATPase subunit epsilon